jgi:hypothetical protein
MSKDYPNWCRRHANVLKWLIEHPANKQKDCARALGYSESQVSRIVNSPGFKMRFREFMGREFERIIESRLQH